MKTRERDIMKNKSIHSSDDATMTTKLTGDVHPFPIPKRVADEVSPYVDIMTEPAYRGHTSALSNCRVYGLHLFNEFEEVFGNLRNISEALDRIKSELIEDNSEWGAVVHAISLGLEREIMRGQAVWDWAKATWEYDPAIKMLAQEGSSSPEKNNSPDRIKLVGQQSENYTAQ
jgi:hypothetical protein